MPKNWLVKQSPRPAQAVVQEELTQGSSVGDVILAGGSKRREAPNLSMLSTGSTIGEHQDRCRWFDQLGGSAIW